MVTDHQNPALKLIIRGQEVSRCLIDGGPGVNVIRLGLLGLSDAPNEVDSGLVLLVLAAI